MILDDNCIHVGGRILLRPLRDSDTLRVCYWRNLYRANYFRPTVVTPSTHRAWLAAKPAGDDLWMVEDWNGNTIGMTSLTQHPGTLTAEYGRTLVDPHWQGLGYGTEIEWTAMAVGFDLLRYELLDGELMIQNTKINQVHTRCGWDVVGIDVAGHCHPPHQVLYIQLHQSQWPVSRELFRAWLHAKYNLTLDTEVHG